MTSQQKCGRIIAVIVVNKNKISAYNIARKAVMLQKRCKKQ